MANTTVIEKTKTRTKIKIEPPEKWKVVLINDDKTSMDFVIALLIEIFDHTMENATHITLKIHESGSGVAGVYEYEIAETKAVEATQLARLNNFPLQVKMEKA